METGVPVEGKTEVCMSYGIGIEDTVVDGWGRSPNSIKVVVPGVPVAQPRARAVSFAGHARVYEHKRDHPVATFKAAVQIAARAAYQGPLVDSPISMLVTLVMPRPSNKFWKTRPMPRLPHTSRPDADNVLKAILDSLTGVIFRNDTSVWDVRVRKLIADGDEQPHTEIEMEW